MLDVYACGNTATRAMKSHMPQRKPLKKTVAGNGLTKRVFPCPHFPFLLTLAVLLGVGTLNIITASGFSVQPFQSFKPGNVLVLVADDFGVDKVGLYNIGTNPPKTPNLDALAQKGMVFRNAYSNPMCCPTRATIQTGRYSFRTGIGWIIQAEPAYAMQLSEVAIPEMLDNGNSGYAHAAFGKWHLGNGTVGGALAPNNAGYSYYAGSLANITNYFSWNKTTNGVTALTTKYATTDTVDEALAWINTQTKSWFAYVAFNAPHKPYHAPPSNLHSVDLTNPTTILQYSAMVEAMDTEIGRLLMGLERMGALKNTTIIFMGDNGTPTEVIQPPLNPLHSKTTLYEGGINVPFIVQSPYISRPGVESKAFVGTVDVFATVAQIAGVNLTNTLPPGTKIDSISLIPYLEKPSTPSIRPMNFAEKFDPNGSTNGLIYHPPTPNPSTSSVKAARNEKYKLIWDLITQKEEFYDLESDPFEQQNLLAGGSLLPNSSEQAAYTQLKQQIISLVSS